MKTVEQIKKRIEVLESRNSEIVREIKKDEELFEKGVKSFTEAERINRRIEENKEQLHKNHDALRVLYWVLEA